jgi:hypothetical protein
MQNGGVARRKRKSVNLGAGITKDGRTDGTHSGRNSFGLRYGTSGPVKEVVRSSSSVEQQVRQARPAPGG